MSNRFSWLFPKGGALAAAFLMASPSPALAQSGFTGQLSNSDQFGGALAGLGDLDGDSVPDLAVGAIGDDDGGSFSNRGAAWLLFLNDDGTVKGHQKISATEGGFAGTLEPDDQFGASLANLGDLDGDSVPDLAVGAPGTDDGGNQLGAVWILFLNDDGTVKGHQKIGAMDGGFSGALDDLDRFGFSLASVGDLDGDTVPDLAVGAIGDDDGGVDNPDFAERGAAWILFLNANGTVKAHQKISSTEGAFAGPLADFNQFGYSLAALPDMDADGNMELVSGAVGDSDGASGEFISVGAAWVMFLDDAGMVKSSQKISALAGGFAGALDDDDRFGLALGWLADRDGDGNPELLVGSPGDDDGGTNFGAVWTLFLDGAGMVKSHQKLSATEGGFSGDLSQGSQFGSAMASLGNLDADGNEDLAVGASLDDTGGPDRGAVWAFRLGAAPDVAVTGEQKIASPPPLRRNGWMAH